MCVKQAGGVEGGWFDFDGLSMLPAHFLTRMCDSLGHQSCIFTLSSCAFATHILPLNTYRNLAGTITGGLSETQGGVWQN